MPDGGAAGGEEPGAAAGTWPSRHLSAPALRGAWGQPGGGRLSSPLSLTLSPSPLCCAHLPCGRICALSADRGTCHTGNIMSPWEQERTWCLRAVLPGADGSPRPRRLPAALTCLSGIAPRTSGTDLWAPLKHTEVAGLKSPEMTRQSLLT